VDLEELNADLGVCFKGMLKRTNLLPVSQGSMM